MLCGVLAGSQLVILASLWVCWGPFLLRRRRIAPQREDGGYESSGSARVCVLLVPLTSADSQDDALCLVIKNCGKVTNTQARAKPCMCASTAL